MYYPYPPALEINSSSVTVSNSIIRHNKDEGIYVYNASPTITDNQFTDNVYAILMTASSAPVLSGNTAMDNTYNGVAVSESSVSTDTTWNAGDLPYILVGNVTVNSGRTLTLAAGTEVRFKKGYTALIVNGTLRAQGTAEDPILFTSNEASPAKGDWWSITFGTTSVSSVLEHVVVEYAGYAMYYPYPPALEINSSSVTVSNSIIRHNKDEGVYVYNASPTIMNSTITDNADGVYVQSGSPNINDNDIYDNSEYGVYNAVDTTCINAENNWWGSDFGPNDPSAASDTCGLGARAGFGDKVSDNVDYDPWTIRGVIHKVFLPLLLNAGLLKHHLLRPSMTLITRMEMDTTP